MDDGLKVIIKDTYTLSDLRHRIRVLRAYLSKIFFGAADLTLNEEDLLWINSLPKDFLAKFDKNNTSREISALEGKVDQLQPLTIYLSFETNTHSINLLGSMVRELFHPQILLDIKYDPTLLAGCALSWKGVYKDYSLKAKIEERKGEVLESFKKFLR